MPTDVRRRIVARLFHQPYKTEAEAEAQLKELMDFYLGPDEDGLP